MVQLTTCWPFSYQDFGVGAVEGVWAPSDTPIPFPAYAVPALEWTEFYWWPAGMAFNPADSVGGQSLTQTARFDDSTTFFTHNITQSQNLVQVARFDVSDSFFGHSAAHRLPQAVRFDDAATFYSGQFNVWLTQAARFADDPAFYSASLSYAHTQFVRFDDEAIFYPATVTAVSPPVAVTRSGGMGFRRRIECNWQPITAQIDTPFGWAVITAKERAAPIKPVAPAPIHMVWSAIPVAVEMKMPAAKVDYRRAIMARNQQLIEQWRLARIKLLEVA
jgi:hypothetical protein